MRTEFNHTIYYGAKDTMEKVAASGYRALNPKTMRYQVVDKDAKYEVAQDSGILYMLKSDRDLRAIAKDKGLIV